MSYTSLGHPLTKLIEVLSYRLDRYLTRLDLTPLRIALIYTIFGFGLLYFSDVFLVRTIEDLVLLQQLQTVKGGLEVMITAGLIFALTRQSRQSLEQANSRLQQRQAELDVLHRVLRHNLRNDTNVIRGYAHLLEEQLDQPDLTEQCETIVTIAESILRYTEQASKINAVAAENGVRTTLHLSTMIQNMLETHPHVTEEIAVSTSLPESAPVEANQTLPEAIEELITNAIIHNDHEEPTVSIAVDPQVSPAYLTELTITDNGPGIPEHERETLRQRGEDSLVHSNGMGLWFAYWSVEMSDGTFRIEDHDSRGTKIRIRLPKAPEQSWIKQLNPETQ